MSILMYKCFCTAGTKGGNFVFVDWNCFISNQRIYKEKKENYYRLHLLLSHVHHFFFCLQGFQLDSLCSSQSPLKAYCTASLPNCHSDQKARGGERAERREDNMKETNLGGSLEKMIHVVGGGGVGGALCSSSKDTAYVLIYADEIHNSSEDGFKM